MEAGLNMIVIASGNQYSHFGSAPNGASYKTFVELGWAGFWQILQLPNLRQLAAIMFTNSAVPGSFNVRTLVLATRHPVATLKPARIQKNYHTRGARTTLLQFRRFVS